MANVLKFRTLYFIPFLPNFCFFILLFLIIFGGMANNVDPDQTPPSEAFCSGSALFAYSILSEILVYKILRHLPVDFFSTKEYWYFSYFSTENTFCGH